jgi:hypothetical protein
MTGHTGLREYDAKLRDSGRFLAASKFASMEGRFEFLEKLLLLLLLCQFLQSFFFALFLERVCRTTNALLCCVLLTTC